MVYHAINNFVLKKHRKCFPIHTFAGYSCDQCEYKVAVTRKSAEMRELRLIEDLNMEAYSYKYKLEELEQRTVKMKHFQMKSV